ncbi:carboxymuconolactone decarboxylase family protein [Xanthobacter oligotrophicus]|uniref:Carboxymuconolactone decarboxylase family protein n=1 Tax=Xanthobacter oligotrophicus TaxID=2607286 RepID=A0ABW6ZT44_9HYPH
MKLPAALAAAMSLAAPAEADAGSEPERVAPPIVHEVTPALGTYTDAVLFGDVWKRPDLSPRDRSLVTIAALVAGGNTAQMTGHFNRGLDNGVTPDEIAATITHLAFYAGWPKAMSAVGIAKDVFTRRNLGPDQVAPEPGPPITLDAASEARRAAAVEAQVGAVAPALATYTNAVLFGDLWRRADLTPRDRSLVTIVALIVNSQTDQLPFHLHRGMDNGLTRTQLSEVITHLAFYAGWPRAMSAIPAARTVFEDHMREQAGDPASAQGRVTMDILHPGAGPSTPGPVEYFTGSVKISSRFQRDAPARIGGASVSFEPGARTAWHTHPLGQTLVVTAGCGWVQQEGEDIQEMGIGDIVWIPPGVKHWHGATPGSSMTHIAVAEALDGKSVDWMEHVTDEQYRRGRRSGGC